MSNININIEKQKQWEDLADRKKIEKVIESLKMNNIEAEYMGTGEDAKMKILSMIPEGSEVFTLTSVTLDSIGIPKEINESGKYDSIRNKLNKMDRKTQGREMQKLGSAPDYVISSVHALTEDGKIIIASNTGSQLSSQAYGSSHVIFVIGAQKLVKNLDEGIKRIYDYILPLESVRINKSYKVSFGSNVSKLLIINKEISPGRIKVLIVNEKLGF